MCFYVDCTSTKLACVGLVTVLLATESSKNTKKHVFFWFRDCKKCSERSCNARHTFYTWHMHLCLTLPRYTFVGSLLQRTHQHLLCPLNPKPPPVFVFFGKFHDISCILAPALSVSRCALRVATCSLKEVYALSDHVPKYEVFTQRREYVLRVAHCVLRVWRAMRVARCALRVAQ